MSRTGEPATTLTVQGISNFAGRIIRHGREDRGKVFVAVASGWFLSIGVRTTYPVLIPFFRTEFDLSLTLAGMLITTLWMSYALGQVPGGMLADRFGEGVTMAASMAIAAITVVLIMSATGPLVLYVGTALLGVAIALFGVVRLTSLADIYPENVGTVHGLLGSVGDIGNSLLPPTVLVIAAATAWQFGFAVFLPLFFLVAVALWRFVPTRTSPRANTSGTLTGENLRRVGSVLRHPSLVLGTLIMILGIAITQAFTGFFPTYLIEEKGIAAPLAGGIFAAFFALGIVVRPSAGIAYDRIGVRRSLLFFVGVSVIGFVFVPLVDHPAALLSVTVVIAIMTGRGTVIMAYMTVSLPADVQNTGLGISRTVFFTLGSTSPIVFGAIADRGYFDEAFFLLAGLSVVSILLILRLPTLER